MPKGVHHDEKTRAKALAMLDDGMSGADVARALNVTETSVSQWKRNRDQDKPRTRSTRDEVKRAAVAQMIREGFNYEAIAEKLTVNVRTISKWRAEWRETGMPNAPEPTPRRPVREALPPMPLVQHPPVTDPVVASLMARGLRYHDAVASARVFRANKMQGTR